MYDVVVIFQQDIVFNIVIVKWKKIDVKFLEVSSLKC